jgi:hypothetical protein
MDAAAALTASFRMAGKLQNRNSGVFDPNTRWESSQ